MLIHIGDTRTVVDPETLPARLKSAGLDRVDVRTGSRLVFHGYTARLRELLTARRRATSWPYARRRPDRTPRRLYSE